MDKRWIIMMLLMAMMIAIVWRNEWTNMPDPKWTQCKESLVVQVFTGACTLRYKGEVEPS